MGAVISDQLETVFDVAGLSGYTGSFDRAARAVGILTHALDENAKKQLGVGIVAGGLSAAILTGLTKAAMAAGDMEQIEIGFRTTLGGETQAKAKIRELQAFAAKTPFDFGQSAKGAQGLLAMGIEGEKLIPIMQATGDAVAAAGGDTETFLGILNAMGQIKTKGKLAGDELLQMSNRGIGAAKILQEELGVTQDQLSGMDADKVIEALTRGFNKRFGGAMDAQSKTLKGSLSNLQDTAGQLAVSLGQLPAGPLTALAQAGSGLLGVVQDLPQPVKDLIPIFGIGLAGALGLTALQMGYSTYQAGRLAGENAKLLNASLKAGQAAEKQKLDEDADAAAMDGASSAANLLTGRLNPLAAAHDRAAASARRQADAESRLGNGAPAARSVPLKPSEIGAAVRGGNARPVGEAVAKVGEEALEAEGAALKQSGGKGWLARLKNLGKFGAPAAEGVEVVGAAEAGAVAAKGAGMLGKLKGGLPGILAGLAADLALNLLPDEGAAGTGKRLTKGAIEGATLGATIGSFIPVVGTAAGGVIGGAVGAGVAGFGEWQRGQEAEKAAAAAAKPAEKSDPHLATLQQIADLLRSIESKDAPLGYDQLSAADQKLGLLKSLG